MYTSFAYAFAYAIKQTPYAFVAKIILCMYLLYDGTKGVIVKFPYDSGHPKGLGSCIKECMLNFDSILQFEKDVFVIEVEEEILIVKICENELIPQETNDSIFSIFSAISPDGCAVFLYNYRSEYQLWEFAR